MGQFSRNDRASNLNGPLQGGKMQTAEALADLLNEIGGERGADSGFKQEVPEAGFFPEGV
jgi:hypothetical protein